jgi:hypothetical protein
MNGKKKRHKTEDKRRNARETPEFPLWMAQRPRAALAQLAGGAWDIVDTAAKREIARRRPSRELLARTAKIADILEREFRRPNAP